MCRIRSHDSHGTVGASSRQFGISRPRVYEAPGEVHSRLDEPVRRQVEEGRALENGRLPSGSEQASASLPGSSIRTTERQQGEAVFANEREAVIVATNTLEPGIHVGS